MTGEPACFNCLHRTWLIGQMAGHLEHHRSQIDGVLSLEDMELITALGGQRRSDLLKRFAGFTDADAQRMLDEADEIGLAVRCRHGLNTPLSLEDLEHAQPACLYVASVQDRLTELAHGTCVAIVGSRRASPAGREIAREMGQALAAAGVTVVSGMAVGIDAAAHEGALESGGATVAVLPGPANRAYPVAKTRLYGQIRAEGAVISEIPPGPTTFRWAMLARNRLIAGLAHLTVVVEAAARSGALTTLAYAQTLNRTTAAVPGAVGSALAAGTNHAIAKQDAKLVRGPQDVLDLLFGDGMIEAPAPRLPELTEAEAAVLGQIREGTTNVAGFGAEALGALSGLELKGWVRRGPGGGLTAKIR